MKSGDYEVKYLNKNELEILKYLGSAKNLVIPNEIEGRRVTSIGDWAFCECSGLTNITILDSVTSIRNNAFYECAGLTNITIPNSVTSIGEEAFFNCSSLISIVIPNSVTRIEDWAFAGCTGLTSITIPNSVTSIGEKAFYNCSSLTSIVIPNSVTRIGRCAFSGYSGLTYIDIQSTKIKTLSYFDCTNLTEIIAHKGCSSLLLKEIMEHAIAKDLNSMIKDEYLEWIRRKQFDDVINYAREKERVEILARLIETYHKRFEKSNKFEI